MFISKEVIMARAILKRPKDQPAEHQEQRPGHQSKMRQKPISDQPYRRGAGKLNGKVAIVTGGDSGIGRAVAIAFAKEGADLTISYLNEHEDAKETQRLVEEHGASCLLIAGDVGDEKVCKKIADRTVKRYGKVHILVNNAAEQQPQAKIEDISSKQLERTFRTNIFSMFYMTKAVMPYLKKGAAIVNTASITAYKGNPTLLDYSSTKGAIIAFTRSLSQNLAKKNIRVNAVAPGPVWTPLIPSTFPPKRVKQFGKDVPMGRPGQPEELAPAFVYLASDDSSYVSGQTIHVNGGTVVSS
jgi:NAD(P)-dependent dehydrogenase (short-subunit alcohol dehydrogenase family)